MAVPVFKFFMGRFTEAWYQLSTEEQSQLSAKVNATLDQVGGKRVLLCASWASQQYPFWGVEEFPDVAAAQKHAELLWQLGWFRYTDSVTLLGSSWAPPS